MNVNRTKLLLSNTEKCVESRISAGGTEKITRVGKASRKDGGVVPRHGRTCSKKKMRCKILRTGEQEDKGSCTQFQVLAWMIIKSRRRSLDQWENSPMYALARIGGPDVLRTANKLARSVTKWTRACDRRLARLISYIHHTSDRRQCCHVGNTDQHC